MKIIPLQRKPRVNSIGIKFGDWLLLELLGQTEDKSTQVYLCLCSCGIYKKVLLKSLQSKRSSSCGHYKDYSGQKFGRLILLENLRKFKDRYTYYKCLCDCGKIVTIRLSHIIQGLIKSCNCLNTELKKQRLYNSELTDEERSLYRNSKEYRAWRFAVLDRDQNMCVLCSKKSDLVAHHLNNYVQYVDLRTEISNGITLCRSCHKKFHNKYVGHVIKEQFEEYKLLCQVQ